VGGRPLQATGVHERMMELLTTIGTPKVHSSVTPRKVAERVKLGEVVAAGESLRISVRASEVRDAFYCFIHPPRLNDLSVLRKAISRGVAEGSFAWYSGPAPALGPDGKLQVNRERVIVGIQLSEDEIDFDSGYLLVPAALPEVQQAISSSGAITGQPTTVVPAGLQPVSPTQPVAGAAAGEKRTVFAVKFRATRDQVFKAFPAIANLADKSDEGKLTIQIEATNAAGYDPTWLRNAIQEPLDEADVERG
jgi:hypothetical protein